MNDYERYMLQQRRQAELEEEEKNRILSEMSAANSLNNTKFKEFVREEGYQESKRTPSTFITTVRTKLMEASLNKIFDKCFEGCRFETEPEFNHSLVNQFVQENGVNSLLLDFSTSTPLLSELALRIENSAKKLLESDDVDMENPDTQAMDSDELEDIVDDIDGDSEIEDICDQIRARVSRATEEFIQKNTLDKVNIKDILATTKDKCDNIKSGDDATDELIKQEAEISAHKQIRAIYNRPHKIFEKLVLNISEACVKNHDLAEVYLNESGKINMDMVVSKATSIYTFMEFVDVFRIHPVDEQFIKEMITILPEED